MEKETLVLDASVIVKWFCEEEYTDIALWLSGSTYPLPKRRK
jgi:predicted nucleic acid-binding protein